MFSRSQPLYDLIYGRMKDDAAEARDMSARIRRDRPGARAALDVACGTGEHARHLAADGPGVHVARMSHGSVEGRLSRIFEYLVGRPDGITRAAEDHEAGLFTVDETLACFRDAGFDAAYESGPMGRGLCVARAV